VPVSALATSCARGLRGIGRGPARARARPSRQLDLAPRAAGGGRGRDRPRGTGHRPVDAGLHRGMCPRWTPAGGGPVARPLRAAGTGNGPDHGEQLRRAKQRAAARQALRAALATFEELDARSWAGRARAELQATGETARRLKVPAVRHLTPQEFQVAQLVAEGSGRAGRRPVLVAQPLPSVCPSGWWSCRSRSARPTWRSPHAGRPPARRPSRGIRTPNRQIRRLVLSVHAVRQSAVCAAQVGGRVQGAPDNPSGDGWWTTTRTAMTAGSNPLDITRTSPDATDPA
jgi:hypothetical protein